MFGSRIIGVDFSGARLAGEKIWLAQVENARLTCLQRADELPDSALERAPALAALVRFLEQQESAVVGLDFPFSLHESALEGQNWRDWLDNIARFDDAETFKAAFADARRECDVKSKTPLSPLNHRLFRQTFHGIRDVLRPLVERGAVVLPMMEPRASALTLVEICPASLLKKENLYLSYKGKSATQRTNRETILAACEARFGLQIGEEDAQRALGDTEGDALDAILGAVSVQRALLTRQIGAAQTKTEAREGRVYF